MLCPCQCTYTCVECPKESTFAVGRLRDRMRLQTELERLLAVFILRTLLGTCQQLQHFVRRCILAVLNSSNRKNSIGIISDLASLTANLAALPYPVEVDASGADDQQQRQDLRLFTEPLAKILLQELVARGAAGSRVSRERARCCCNGKVAAIARRDATSVTSTERSVQWRMSMRCCGWQASARSSMATACSSPRSDGSSGHHRSLSNVHENGK